MFRELLAREFAPYGSLTGRQLDLLESHYNLLTRWNQRLNLTRIESLEHAVRLHYCESLFAAIKLAPGHLKIVDVGSGAGFPGIPIAILRPECQVTLVESHKRKSIFLAEVSRTLNNVTVVAERAENLKSQFDWLVSRAVNPADIAKLNVAKNRALLVGATDAHRFEVKQSVPWGESRYLVFHVERP